MTDKTIFEKIADREMPGTFLYEDDVCMVIKNIHPVAPIHYLVIPKKAFPAIDKLSSEQHGIVEHLMRAAQHVITTENIKNFKLIFNGGKYLHLPEHLHLHLLGGDELED